MLVIFLFFSYFSIQTLPIPKWSEWEFIYFIWCRLGIIKMNVENRKINTTQPKFHPLSTPHLIAHFRLMCEPIKLDVAHRHNKSEPSLLDFSSCFIVFRYLFQCVNLEITWRRIVIKMNAECTPLIHFFFVSWAKTFKDESLNILCGTKWEL